MFNNLPLDERDEEIAKQRLELWDNHPGPRVGDWIEMNDGTRRRFAHDWGDGLQTTTPKFGLGSFYLGAGFASYSGALDPLLPLDRIEPTDAHAPAWFWFFKHDWAGAGRGVNVQLAARVFREKR